MAKKNNDVISSERETEFVTGTSGAGKTMLLAELVQSLRGEQRRNAKNLAYEPPIEFVYDDEKRPVPIAEPTEI